MSDFKLSVGHKITLAEATVAADEIEKAVGEIVNGKRKPSQIPSKELAVLVQFVRDKEAYKTNFGLARATDANSYR